MTIILATTTITGILSVLFARTIHRFRYLLYAFSVVAALVFAEVEGNIVSMGYVPLGIFIVVMFSGVMDKGTLRKRLFMVRAELAVVASILLAPHVLAYLEYYLEEIGLFNGGLSFYLGVLAFITVIPLFITSFQLARKPMGYKRWKKLHRLSYLFYLAVGLHLILIQNDRMWLYIFLFITYFALRIVTYIDSQKKKRKTP